MEEREEKPPKTKTEPDSGSGGGPPRPTAVGCSDAGGDGELHIGQTVGCVVVATVPDGYVVELASGKKMVRGNAGGYFIHAILITERQLRIGERTMAKLIDISSDWLVLEDSIVGTTPRKRKIVDPTLPVSGTPALPAPEDSELSERSTEFPELEQIPKARAIVVRHFALPPASVQSTEEQSCRLENKGKFELCSTAEFMEIFLDKRSSWSSAISKVRQLVDAMTSLVIDRFSGVAELSQENEKCYFIFLGGQNLVYSIESGKVLHDPLLDATSNICEGMLFKGNCVFSYQAQEKSLARMILSFAEGEPISKDKEFSSLRSLTEYFLTISNWNKSSGLLLLQEGSESLFVKAFAGKFDLAWNYGNRSVTTNLQDVSNFIAEHPDAKVWMY